MNKRAMTTEIISPAHPQKLIWKEKNQPFLKRIDSTVLVTLSAASRIESTPS